MRSRLQHESISALVLCVVLVLQLSMTGKVQAFELPKNLKQGWQGDVQLGAFASFGPTNSSAVSAHTVVSYSDVRWEHELDAKLYRSVSESFVTRLDVDGVALRDASDNEIKDLVRSTTNDRRYMGAQSRWFFAANYFLFGIADVDVNTPANLKSSSRQIVGVGYKLYRSKHDLLSAAVGVGRKQRYEESGDSEKGSIGYVGLRFKKKVGEKTSIGVDFESDFGGESRYSQAETSLNWKLRDPLSIKLKYEIQFTSGVFDPLNTFDDGFKAALSVNLAIEVF